MIARVIVVVVLLVLAAKPETGRKMKPLIIRDRLAQQSAA
jgi:hypothetical protein